MSRTPVAFFLLAASALAQGEVFPITDRIAAVPTVKQVLGFELGERHTSTHEVVRYAEAVARASDRVAVDVLGVTDTGLPVMRAIVTRAGRDRRAVERVSRRLMAGGDASAPADQPVTAWFTMSIHGNEASGVEAGLAILYYLAASRDAEATRILDKVVLHIELVSNPDGRERFVQGVRDRKSSGAPNEDKRAWDHDEPWPGGRTNHYLFDLNRDWFLQTQIETRFRVAAVLEAAPQVLCDFHEMGTDRTYYFSAPPAMPTNHHVTQEVRDQQKRLGDAIGRWFDERGWPYWTADTFPADYPGYGGSWPCVLGAAGFTFEQASSRSGRVLRADGSTHTLREALERHAGAGMAVLAEASRTSADVMARWAAHFRRVKSEGEADELPWFVFSSRGDARMADRLAQTLRRNGIEARQLTAPADIETVPLTGGPREVRTLPKGSWVVSSRQAFRPLLLALCDPEVKPEPEFLEAEAKRRAHGERSEVYDVSAWNLPLLFGVESYRAAVVPGAGTVNVSPAPDATDDPRAVAWLFTAHDKLVELLEKDVRVRVVPFPFTAGRTFEPGTFLVLRDRNEESVAAACSGLFGVRSLATSEGHDLGSGRTVPIKRPKIVLATGDGTSAYSTGASWWLFENAVRVPHVRVATSDLRGALEEADTLVLPDGRYSDLDKEMLENFVKGGGTVVAIRGAVSKLVALELVALKRKEKTEKLGGVAGAIVRTSLKERHWLGHGYASAPVVQVRTSRYWVTGSDAVKTVVSCEKGSLGLSGILTDDQAAALAGMPLVIEQKIGRGRIVGFVEDPAFRGTTPAMWHMYLTAILIGPSRP